MEGPWRDPGGGTRVPHLTPIARFFIVNDVDRKISKAAFGGLYTPKNFSAASGGRGYLSKFLAACGGLYTPQSFSAACGGRGTPPNFFAACGGRELCTTSKYGAAIPTPPGGPLSTWH
jgi:hypothetical protein